MNLNEVIEEFSVKDVVVKSISKKSGYLLVNDLYHFKVDEPLYEGLILNVIKGVITNDDFLVNFYNSPELNYKSVFK